MEFNRYEIEHDSFGGFIPVRCWVTDDFKLVLNLFTSDELYDRRNDPNEMHNLIDDIHFADVRSKMHDALLDYMDKIRDPFRSYQWNLSVAQRCTTALDGGVSSTPTGWLFSSGTRL